MKSSVGDIPNRKSLMTIISAFLFLGLNIIEPVEAAHPWISSAATSATSSRRFSTSDPFAVLQASSKTKKTKEEEDEKTEPVAPKRPSFFSRTSQKESEKPKEQESVAADKTQNGRKKSSWKEVRKPKKDDNAKKKRRGFRFGSKSSKEEDKSTPETKPSDVTQDPKENNETNKPKRKSRFQLAREARKARQQEKEAAKSSATDNDSNNAAAENDTKNATTTVDVSSSNATITNNTTSASNTTVVSFGVPTRNLAPGKYPQPIMYQPRPYPSRPSGIIVDGPGGNSGMPSNAALFATAMVSILGVVSRLWIVLFITRKLASDAEDLLPPVQHVVWECLNDKYSKDARIFGKALSQPPLGFTRRHWKRYRKQQAQQQKRLRKQQEQVNTLQQAVDSMNGNNSTSDEGSQSSENPIMTMLGRRAPEFPSQTTIVVDLAPKNEQLNLQYLSDVVNLLIQVHSSNNHHENFDRRIAPMKTEVVLLLTSPGGAVITYGLAAAQVARLEKAGIRTTVCVDQVAASGGYMIASQTSQIIAAPFSMVGSIGVIQEGLNFNKILEKYGVKPLVLKAGEHKSPLSTFGPVSDKDLKEETKRMKETHEAFIELCTSRRPSLDTSICDGTVLLASRALGSGLVDRIMTSDEYVWERICAGDHVLKLHRTMRTDHRRVFARALDLLPHLRERIQRMDLQKVVGHVVQGYAFFSMIRNQFGNLLWSTH